MKNNEQYEPQAEHKFSFGLWTLENRGRDPFGDFVRPVISPIEIVRTLGEVGAWGVNLHDNDLVPFDATPAERDRIVRDFKQALSDYGMIVPIASVSTDGMRELQALGTDRQIPLLAWRLLARAKGNRKADR